MAKEDSAATKAREGCIVAILGIPTLTVAATLADGYVGRFYWASFVAPTFHVPTLSFWQAAGLCLAANWFTYQTLPLNHATKELTPLETVTGYLGSIAIRFCSALVVGTIIRHILGL